MVLDVWKAIKKRQFAPVYLLYGTESFLINETKQLLLQHALNEEEVDFNFSQFDLEETSIEAALEEAETLPFMGERRLVVLQNPVFLTAEKSKGKVEHNVKKLEQYLADPAPFSIVILTAPYEKLDERKKITKELKRKAVVLEAKRLKEHELKLWIKERISAAQTEIDDAAINLLIELAGTDLLLLTNEIEKMILYAGGENKIDYGTVERLTAKSLEQNIFTLIDKIMQRQLGQAITIFRDLLRQNEEPIKILAFMASQIRLLYQVKELSRQGYSQQKIATALRVHPFRVKLAMEKSARFQEQELLSILHQLAQADYEMKTGQVDKVVGFELLLLRMNTKR